MRVPSPVVLLLAGCAPQPATPPLETAVAAALPAPAEPRQTEGSGVPASLPAPPPQPATDEYTKDIEKICHVHEITGKSPELGLQAVAQWLLDNIGTQAARERLAELPKANIPVWLQNLRRDAAAKGISPCPFSDTWEEFLNRHRE